MELLRTPLGQFNNESGVFVISDPSYDTSVWCRGELENVLKGMWNAEVGIYDLGKWGRRIALLTAFHESYDEDAEGDLTQHMAEFEVGVDSGQAGIFDKNHYRVGGDEEWNQRCYAATLHTKHHAGIIPFGIVASSGYGDGSYVCFYYKDIDGRIVKVAIVFITESDDE